MADNNIFMKLRDKLFKDAGKDPALPRIAGFIVWLLEKYNHEDIASEMLSKKKDAPTLKDAFGFAKAEAKKYAVDGCACVEDKDVYWSVVRYLNLEDCTSPEDAEAYCSEKVHTHTETEDFLHANAKSSPFSVDLDELFSD